MADDSKVFFPDGSVLSEKTQGFLIWLHTQRDYDALMLLHVIEFPNEYQDEWDHFIVDLERAEC